MKEAEALEGIEKERAKNRQETGNNQHRLKEIFPEPSQGQTRDKVAQQTGIGSGKKNEKLKVGTRTDLTFLHFEGRSQTHRKLARKISCQD